MITTYIGIGSNLEEPLQQVRRALHALEQLPHSRLDGVSRLYRSAPVGPAGQPDYVNAAARVVTELGPEQLLDQLQAIENSHGRVRTIRWGPRTLDLDILLYGSLTLDTPRLHVPHRELANRSFVLYPLADLDADLVLPDGTCLSHLVDGCPPDGLSVISDPTANPDDPSVPAEVSPTAP